jgi:hypothetical protein
MSPTNEPNAVTPPSTAALEAAALGSAPQPSLPLAIAAGLLAALVGAALWAVITVTTKFQIGFMAIGVGFLVAWAVRTFGRGHSEVFGVLGGGFALLGCVLGNLLSACGFLAAQSSEPLVPLIIRVITNPALAAQLVQATFNPMDLLFYAIAVYEGFKFGKRPIRA